MVTCVLSIVYYVFMLCMMYCVVRIASCVMYDVLRIVYEVFCIMYYVNMQYVLCIAYYVWFLMYDLCRIM